MESGRPTYSDNDLDLQFNSSLHISLSFGGPAPRCRAHVTSGLAKEHPQPSQHEQPNRQEFLCGPDCPIPWMCPGMVMSQRLFDAALQPPFLDQIDISTLMFGSPTLEPVDDDGLSPKLAAAQPDPTTALPTDPKIADNHDLTRSRSETDDGATTEHFQEHLGTIDLSNESASQSPPAQNALRERHPDSMEYSYQLLLLELHNKQRLAWARKQIEELQAKQGVDG